MLESILRLSTLVTHMLTGSNRQSVVVYSPWLGILALLSAPPRVLRNRQGHVARLRPIVLACAL